MDDLVFGLDIGTRNIVGVVGYLDRTMFKVVAMAAKEHETRAMIDGQIHDIYKVGDAIRVVKNELESQLDKKLTDVCIAAAGRVLRTVNVSAEYEFDEETRVNQEHIYSLNLMAVEKAHNEINTDSSIKFYCVGNTPVKYMLNDYDINNLEGHKASKIGVDLIATFLPEEVVDGLYEAVNYAGLQVGSLTLEPIAAINIAIPEQFRLLNIALVDVGAGTSDICITKDGSIVAYGMIPYAGDEITEVIAKSCLVDFNTAETIKVSASSREGTITYKDIMGLSQEVKAEDICKMADPVIDKIAKEVANKIVEINGNKPTNAVFVVGGGGKIAGYTEKVAEYLGIPKERVAVRGEEVLTSVDFGTADFKKDSLYVTPIGICTNYYSQKNNFVFVTVNDQRLKLYDNNKLTVVDAIMQVGFPNEKLFPRRGKELTFTMNEKTRLVRGTAGEGAIVSVNGKQTNLNAKIQQNDSIEVVESTIGEPATLSIGQLEEFNAILEFIVNDKKVICPKFAYVNGELKSEFYDIKDNDDIKMKSFYTVSQLFEFLDYDITGFDVYVNNELANRDTKVYENFTLKTAAIGNGKVNIEQEIEEIKREVADADAETDAETDVETDAEFEEQQSRKVQSQPSTKQAVSQSANVTTDIVILINKEPVRLSGKSSYILVDLFEFYNFDLSKPRGNIVLKLNGVTGQHTAQIKDGDIVDLYWEETAK